MQERFGANIDSARVLIDVLRGAIENSAVERAKRRLLLLLDAIEGELRLLTTSTKRRAATVANRKAVRDRSKENAPLPRPVARVQAHAQHRARRRAARTSPRSRTLI
ncbi:MAG: hypothetical protein JWM53_5472 [bacterium]|nr:hypothetical protein [bacterium]